MASLWLSLVLEGARIHGNLLAHKVFRAPWGLALPERPVARFHLVVQGSCWLRRAGAEPEALDAGDLVLLCRPGAHELVGAPENPAVPIDTLSAEVWGPDRGAPAPGDALLVCGEFSWWSDRFPPLFEALPALLKVPGHDGRPAPFLVPLLALLAEEGRTEAPGRSLVVERLLEVLLIGVLRHTLVEGTPGVATWLGALADPPISRALAALHGAPERRWSVESLAEVAHLSRAAFSRRFTRKLGRAPMEYLTWWRLQRAQALLRDQGLSVKEVAQATGYGSPYSFSKAFQQAFGIAPGRFRDAAPEEGPYRVLGA